MGSDYSYTGKSDRAEDCINLFDFAFENYNTKTFLKKDSVIKQIDFTLNNSETKTLNIVPKNDLILKTTTNIDEVLPDIRIYEDLVVPIIIT